MKRCKARQWKIEERAGLRVCRGDRYFSGTMWRLKARRVIWQAIVVFLGVTAVWTFSARRTYLFDSELHVQDYLVKTAANVVDDRLLLIALDEPTLSLGMVEPEEIAQSRSLQQIQTGYPFSRAVCADAIDRILSAGAKVVVLDLVFPKPREGDDELAATLKKWQGRVVLGSSFDIGDYVRGGVAAYVPPLPELAEASGNWVGFVSLAQSDDSVVRWFYPYASLTTFLKPGLGYGGEHPIPALSVLAARIAGHDLPPTRFPIAERFSYLKPGSITRRSLYTVFVPALWQSNLANGAAFKDKIVLIGATATRLQDVHPTPLGPMAGPDIHLNIISAILRDAWYHEPRQLLTVLSVPLQRLAHLFCWLCCVAGPWLSSGLGSLRGLDPCRFLAGLCHQGMVSPRRSHRWRPSSSAALALWRSMSRWNGASGCGCAAPSTATFPATWCARSWTTRIRISTISAASAAKSWRFSVT